MKIYRDRKCYNTETAEEVASVSHGNYSDFHSYSEELYLTKKGVWFLYGQGGPMSKYAESVGNGSIAGGAGFAVLSSDEALEWLEENEEIDAIEEHFADEIEEA